MIWIRLQGILDPIYDAIARGSGAFQHGHTYHGHPLAAAAAAVGGSLAVEVSRASSRAAAASRAGTGRRRRPHSGCFRTRLA